MLRNRLFILLGGCLLAASAACADDLGFVDCSNHSEDTQVFGKARKTPEVVASVPCGERFTILIYGFVFSRIQTSDGKVGYVYSNLISVDRSATVAQKTASPRMVASAEKVPVTNAGSAQPAPTATAKVQTASAQVAQPQAAPPKPSVAASPVTTTPVFTAPVSTDPAQRANATETAQAVAQPDPPAAAPSEPVKAQPETVSTISAQPAASQVASTQAPPTQSSASTSSGSVSVEAVPQPEPPTPAQPEPAKSQPAAAEPAAAQPAPAPIRPADARSGWERPLPSVRHAPLIELFGGYAFARFDNGAGAPATNLNGALGSFGYNYKPWFQLVADTSYNFTTTNGVKNVLYGNHYGARFFRRMRNRWAATPFVEGLVGGSRADTTVSGVGGYTTSQNCISYKAGGGIDLHPSRRWEIRVIDFDYYRTSFGTNLHQNNYWASAGVVLRLFGGSPD